MRLHHTLFVSPLLLFAAAAHASEASWMFLPGWYTHSPTTGKHVAQYQPEAPSIVPVDPTYQESGYRHQEISIGPDHLNLVQTWGAGTAIRPYGEWEYPYRAGATPYGPWGNPQGPWTPPFDSWQNPYGRGRSSCLYNNPGSGNPGGPGYCPINPGRGGYCPAGPNGDRWQSPPQALPGQNLPPAGDSAKLPPPPPSPAMPGQSL